MQLREPGQRATPEVVGRRALHQRPQLGGVETVEREREVESREETTPFGYVVRRAADRACHGQTGGQPHTVRGGPGIPA